MIALAPADLSIDVTAWLERTDGWVSADPERSTEFIVSSRLAVS